jgi:hypothetical protein
MVNSLFLSFLGNKFFGNLIYLYVSACLVPTGACHSTEEAMGGFDSFEKFMWFLLTMVFALILLAAASKCMYDKYINPSKREVTREKILKEKQNAIKTIGKDSVYSFFLSKSLLGWFIALSVIVFQFSVFLFFVWAAGEQVFRGFIIRSFQLIIQRIVFFLLQLIEPFTEKGKFPISACCELYIRSHIQTFALCRL